jgi:hypothetical protein
MQVISLRSCSEKICNFSPRRSFGDALSSLFDACPSVPINFPGASDTPEASEAPFDKYTLGPLVIQRH